MRVIRIANPDAAEATCREGDGEVPRLDLPLARREFLKGSGVLMGTHRRRQRAGRAGAVAGLGRGAEDADARPRAKR